MNLMHVSQRPEWVTQPHKSDKKNVKMSLYIWTVLVTSLHRCMCLCPCPTWGPHPWQGCRVAVWFSFTPWSIHRWLTLELRIWNRRASFIITLTFTCHSHLYLHIHIQVFKLRIQTHIKHFLQPCFRSFVACLFQRLHRVQMFQESGLYYFFFYPTAQTVCGDVLYFCLSFICLIRFQWFHLYVQM